MTETTPTRAVEHQNTQIEKPPAPKAFDNFSPQATSSVEALSFIKSQNAGRPSETAAMVNPQDGKAAILPDIHVLLPSARKAQEMEGKTTKPADPLDILADKQAGPELKLKAAAELKARGVDQFSLKGANGAESSYRIETEKMASGTAVRIWGKDEQGKSHVAMRAISDQAGLRPEGRRDGDFRGDFWKAHMHGDALTSGSEKARVSVPSARTQSAHRARPETTDGHLPKKDAAKEVKTPADRDYLQEHSGEPFSKDELARINTMFDDAMQGVKQLGKIFKIPEGFAAFRSMLEIDIDGSKRAREIDPHGKPHTALGGVDGEKDNYVVLPSYSKRRHGATLNDPALVRANGRIVEAVYADNGQQHKLGEASKPVAEALGYRGSPIDGGTHKLEVDYLVLSGTGPGRGTPMSREEQRAAIRAQLSQWEAKRR
jgi:hypothetical protein